MRGNNLVGNALGAWRNGISHNKMGEKGAENEEKPAGGVHG